MKIIDRLLKYYFSLIIRFPLQVSIGAFIITLISLFFILNLSVKNDLIDMLPSKVPLVKPFRNFISTFGPEENLIIELSPDKDGTLDDSIDFSERLATRLADSKLISTISYKTDFLTQKTIKYCLSHLFLLSDKNIQSVILDRLSRRKIFVELQKFRRAIVTQSITSDEMKFFKMDPLLLSQPVIENILPAPFKDTFDISNGYFQLKGTDTLLMFVKPIKPPSDMNFNRKFMKEIKDKIVEIKLNTPNVLVSLSGAYAIMSESFFSLNREFIFTLIITFVGILVLYGLVYRRLIMLFIMSFSLLVGLIWTIGLITKIFGNLNVVTVIFPAILAGLGADFAIHFMERFFSEISEAEKFNIALEHSFVNTGHGIVISAITTSFAFFTLIITGYPAFIQLGIMAGVGLLFLLFAVFTITPLLLILLFQKSKNLKIKKLPTTTILTSLVLSMRKNRKIVLITIILITMMMLIFASELKFQNNYLTLAQSKNNKALKATKELEKHYGRALNNAFLSLKAENLEELLQKIENVRKKINNFPKVLRPVEIEDSSSWLPSLNTQELRKSWALNKLKEDSKNQNSFKEIHDVILNKVEKLGLNKDFFIRSYLPEINKSFNFESIEINSLPTSIEELFIDPFIKIDKQQKSFKAIIKVIFRQNILFDKNLGLIRKFAKRCSFEIPQIPLINISLVLDQMKEYIIEDILICIFASILIIFLVLWLDFKKIKDVFIALSPVSLALIWMLGLMKISGGSLNAINIAIIPLVIGSGIDDGIHLLHRFREINKDGHVSILESCLRAVVLTSLTTMIGFGVITTVSTPGIASLGLIAFWGIGACLVITLVFLPTLIRDVKNRDLITFLSNK